jgi:hypothetical protein
MTLLSLRWLRMTLPDDFFFFYEQRPFPVINWKPLKTVRAQYGREKKHHTTIAKQMVSTGSNSSRWHLSTTTSSSVNASPECALLLPASWETWACSARAEQ